MSGDEEGGEVVPLNPLPETAGNLAEYEVGLDKAIADYKPAAQEIRVTQNATPETPYGLSDFHLSEATAYAAAIQEHVGPEDWPAVETAFDGLSAAGQANVLEHLAIGAPPAAQNRSQTRKWPNWWISWTSRRT